MADTEIVFSETQQKRRDVIRSLIIGDTSLAQGSAALGVSVPWLRVLRRRYDEHGDQGLVGKRSVDRRPRPSLETKAAALELVRAYYLGCSCAAIQRILAAQHSISVGPETLRRWLIRAGMVGPQALYAIRQAASRQSSCAAFTQNKVPFRYRVRRLRKWLSEAQIPQHIAPYPE